MFPIRNSRYIPKHRLLVSKRHPLIIKEYSNTVAARPHNMKLCILPRSGHIRFTALSSHSRQQGLFREAHTESSRLSFTGLLAPLVPFAYTAHVYLSHRIQNRDQHSTTTTSSRLPRSLPNGEPAGSPVDTVGTHTHYSHCLKRYRPAQVVDAYSNISQRDTKSHFL